GHRMDKKGVTIWMLLTIIGGAIFVGSQAWEWSHFIHGTELGALELGRGAFTLPDGSVEMTKGVIARWSDDSKQALLLPWKDGTEYIKVTGAQFTEMVSNGKEVFGA